MEENKKSFFNLKFMLNLFAYIPLGCAVVAFVIMALVSTKNNLETETKRSLNLAANALRAYYEWDIVEFGAPIYEHDYVDAFLDQDLQLTLFLDDVRYMTSLKDESGNRMEGTTANPDIWATVKNGNDYYSDDVVIGGEDYYVYYIPIRDEAGAVIGMAFAGLPTEDVNTAITTTLSSFLITAAIIIVVFVFVVIFFANMFAAPLKKVTEALGIMANGDLTNKAEIASGVEETRNLVRTYDKLFSELSKVIGKTKDTATSLAEKMNAVTQLAGSASSDTDQISAVIEDLASGATHLAQSVQEISNQMIEMDSSINKISTDVDSLTMSSENIKNANNDATDYMNKVSSSSQESVNAVRNISEQIDATNRAIRSIEEAVEVITSVASQTNLLALNASIEAARAGEAGRGFAVVASEIQSLSEQSNSGANRIREIVAEIMRQSDETVKLSDEVREIITEEQKYISDTTEKFALLNSEIEISLEKISTIAEMTVNLGAVKDVVVSNVSELSAISEENAASNEEASASISNIAGSIDTISGNSDTVNGMAEELTEVISFFN